MEKIIIKAEVSELICLSIGCNDTQEIVQVDLLEELFLEVFELTLGERKPHLNL